MAMTKAEKAEMDALRNARDLARALRWPEYAQPSPMTADEIKENLTFKMKPRYGSDQYACAGWLAIEGRHEWDRPSVNQHFSNGVHSTSDPAGQNWSQGRGVLYHSKREALQSLRLDMTERFARSLAEIDAMLADEPTP